MISFNYEQSDFGNYIVMDKNGLRSFVPEDTANSDYQAYLRWLENPNAEEFTGGTL